MIKTWLKLKSPTIRISGQLSSFIFVNVGVNVWSNMRCEIRGSAFVRMDGAIPASILTLVNLMRSEISLLILQEPLWLVETDVFQSSLRS